MESKDFLVFYGSQKGCAKSIVEILVDEASKRGFDTEAFDLNEIKKMDIAALRTIVCVTSTTGNGEFPDNANRGWRWLKMRSRPQGCLAHINFTVLGLGDTNYDKFCNAGKLLDKRLQELGGNRFYDLGCADEQKGLEDVVEPWMAGLWAKLLELKQQGKALPPSLQPKAAAASDTEVNAAGSSETKEGEGAATARRSPAPSVISEISGAIPADLKSWDQLLPHVSPPEAGSIKPARPPSATWECMEGDSGATGDKVSQGPWVLQQHFEDGKPVHGPGLDASTPVDIPIVHARYLTAGGKTADRRVIHTEVNFQGTAVPTQWQPGDAFGLYCPNPEPHVAAMLKRFNVQPSAAVRVRRVPKLAPSTKAPSKEESEDTAEALRHWESVTWGDFLRHWVDLGAAPKRPILRLLGDHATDDVDKRRLYHLSSIKGKAEYNALIGSQHATIIDVLHWFPSAQPPLTALVNALPAAAPRLYSASSSPLVSSSRISFAFTVVTNTSPSGVKRPGVCTTWLEERLSSALEGTGGDLEVPVKVWAYLKPTKLFRLPAALEKPLVMIGPGTGVTPFVGFMQHREEQLRRRRAHCTAVCQGSWWGDFQVPGLVDTSAQDSTRGPTAHGEYHLFFGCRARTEDFLYRKELERFEDAGVLARLHTAFSREQVEKVYVQHVMQREEVGSRLAALILKEEARVYVCGDGANMIKDVHEALLGILEQHGSMDRKEAEATLMDLTKHQRYLRDIWSA